jgi:hypothetical protein
MEFFLVGGAVRDEWLGLPLENRFVGMAAEVQPKPTQETIEREWEQEMARLRIARRIEEERAKKEKERMQEEAREKETAEMKERIREEHR